MYRLSTINLFHPRYLAVLEMTSQDENVTDIVVPSENETDWIDSQIFVAEDTLSGENTYTYFK